LIVAQVAKDFGISPSCLKRWLTDALREANKRIELPEQENEVLRRGAADLSQANLPGQ